VLSLQLPFALVPLVRFTSSRTLMGEHATTPGWMIAAAVASLLAIACNAWLVFDVIGGRLPSAWMPLALIVALAALGLLAYLALARLRFASATAD